MKHRVDVHKQTQTARPHANNAHALGVQHLELTRVEMLRQQHVVYGIMV